MDLKTGAMFAAMMRGETVAEPEPTAEQDTFIRQLLGPSRGEAELVYSLLGIGEPPGQPPIVLPLYGERRTNAEPDTEDREPGWGDGVTVPDAALIFGEVGE